MIVNQTKWKRFSRMAALLAVSGGIVGANGSTQSDAKKSNVRDSPALEEAQRTNADSNTRRQAALDFLAARGMDERFDRMMDKLAKLRLEEEAEGAGAKKLRAFLEKYLSWEAIKEDVARIYAEHFTMVELKKLEEFYSSEVGQKLSDSMPKLMMKSAAVIKKQLKTHLPELKKLLAEADGTESQKDSSQEGAESLNGSKAPNFSLSDLEGNTVRLSDFRGNKVVLLDFWATWCGPCRKAMPILESLAKKYQDEGLVYLAVNLEESRKKVRRYLEQQDLDVNVIMDKSGQVAEKYQVQGIPTTVLVDKQGEVRFAKTGYSPRLRSELEDEIKALLGKGSTRQGNPGKRIPTEDESDETDQGPERSVSNIREQKNPSRTANQETSYISQLQERVSEDEIVRFKARDKAGDDPAMAWKWAQKLSEENLRQDAQEEILEVWARQAPKVALEKALRLGETSAQRNALEIIGRQMGGNDPNRAWRWAKGITDRKAKQWFRQGVIEEWAHTAPKIAVKRIDQLSEKRAQQDATLSLARQMAKEDFKRAWRLTQKIDHENIRLEIQEDVLRQGGRQSAELALRKAEELSEKYPERRGFESVARQLARETSETVSRSPQEPWKKWSQEGSDEKRAADKRVLLLGDWDFFPERLEEKGYDAKVSSNATALERDLHSAVVLAVARGVKGFTDSHLKRIESFVHSGGGLLLLGEDDFQMRPLNRIARQFGVSFVRDVLTQDARLQGPDAAVRNSQYHRIYKMPVAMKHPTTRGVPHWIPWGSCEIKVNNRHAKTIIRGGPHPDDPSTGVVLPAKEGRVACLGDSGWLDTSTFWEPNEDENYNAKLASNVMTWLARREIDPEDRETASQSQDLNESSKQEGTIRIRKRADGGNGHAYEAVIAEDPWLTWEQAQKRASERGGHLVTITSVEEHEFVVDLLRDKRFWAPIGSPPGRHIYSGPWIGGYQQERAEEPDGGWEWVTGEPFNWLRGNGAQPNDYGRGNENRIQLFHKGTRRLTDEFIKTFDPVWNDVVTDGQENISAYIIEWD